MSLKIEGQKGLELRAILQASPDLKTENLVSCFTPMMWSGESLALIDQRRLPTEEVSYVCSDWERVALAIKEMVVRGAPAIGITAAYGLVLASQKTSTDDLDAKRSMLDRAAEGLSQTRPTAVNLFWAIERMRSVWTSVGLLDLDRALEEEAVMIHLEDIQTCREMGAHGAALLGENVSILTHCNTGALATGGHGTALGVIRSAAARGQLKRVYADETRPFWQGARLTAWELHRDLIPVTVICDSMSAHFMRLGQVDAVFVGADRIAANGDTANKIGTYPLALIAEAHEVPFYVVAPKSTIDLSTHTGDEIPIEQRPDREVTHCGSQQVVPDGVKVENPAFDVTPASLITAIITEEGVINRGGYEEGLAALFT